MAKRRDSKAVAHLRDVADGRHVPDYAHLPTSVDLDLLIETLDVTPGPNEPRSPWATPDLADMARTNALGGI